jgi:hypothetical protein
MQVHTERYGRYEIKSASVKGGWQANAFRGKSLIAKAVGAGREETEKSLKAQLDQLNAIALSECDVDGAPSAKVYEQAFLAIGELHPNYEAMLRAHLRAPDHLISASRLADAAGYANYNAANLHYGRLGYLIAQEIGFSPPKRSNGDPIWTCAIARGPETDPEFPDTSLEEALLRSMDEPNFEWQMRPQVAEALRALGY